MMPLPPPSSVLDVLNAYERAIKSSEPPQKADAIMAQLRTALLRYTLPGWGFPTPEGQRLTAGEVQAGLDYLQNVILQQLPEAPRIQEQMFEALKVSGNSRRNYRLALNKMLDWCKQQPWYPLPQESPRQRTSRQQQRKGSVTQVRLTSRKKMQGYGLGVVESDVIPFELQQELDTFQQFLVNPDQQHDKKDAVGVSTAEQYIQHLLLLLGWLYRVQKVALAELSLKSVVEFVPLRSQQVESTVVEAAAEKTIALVKDYLSWLQSQPLESSQPLPLHTERGSQSFHTASKVWLTVLAVAKFLYHQETDYPSVKKYKDIPVIQRLRQEQRGVIAEIKHLHPLVGDQSKKQLDRVEFFKLVESLRSECVVRFWQNTQSKNQGKTLGPSRSLAAIAQSYQRFLLAAFLAYLEPHRQRVYRQLQFLSGSFTSTDKPVFPSESGAYLYRQGTDWWLKVFPDLYKQGKFSTESWLEQIPNFQYSDGRYFYQYLEEWLLTYCYQKEGETLLLKGLRSFFKPEHSYVFMMQSGEPYTSPASFAALLRIPAYRLTGKALTPDSVRLMLSQPRK